jgi:hypothetical protein
MATIGELLVRLGLDPATYTKGLSTAEASTKSSMGNAGKAFDDAGTHASKFGSVMSGMAMGVGTALTNMATEGIGKVVDVLGDSEKAYQDAAVSTAKLTTAVQNNETALTSRGVTVANVVYGMDKAMESNLQYGFSMDDQSNSLSQLVGVTHDSLKAQSDMSEAMDLARLKGIDLASATNIVMKAQEGNTGALKKLGIVVAPVTTAMDALTASGKKATDAQIAAAKAADLQSTETAALGDITKLAGGQAEAYANTSAGKLAAAHAKVTEAMVKLGAVTDQIVQAVLPPLADAFNNIMDAVGPLLDQIGTDLPPILSTLSTDVGLAVAAIEPFVQAFVSDIPGAIKTLQDAFGPLISGVFDILKSTFDDITSNSDSLTAVLTAIGIAVSVLVVPPFLAWAAATLAATWPIVAIIAGVAALVVVLDKLGVLKVIGATIKDLAAKVMPTLTEAFNIISKAVGDFVNAAMPPLTQAFNTIMPIIKTLIETYIKVLSAEIGFIANTVIPALSAAFDWIVTNVLPPVMSIIKTLIDTYIKVLGTEIGIITNTVLPALGTAFKFITDTVIPAVQAAFKTMGDVIGTVWTGISSAAKTAINLVIGAIRAIISGINSVQLHIDLKPPIGPELKFDYNGPGLPQIPYFHSGGIVPGSGDVLAVLQGGEGVTSRADMARGRGPGGGNTFYITNPVPEPPSVSMAHANLMMAYSGRSGN